METAKRTGTGSIDRNRKKREERNGVEAVWWRVAAGEGGESVCDGSNEDIGGQCRTEDRVCMCVCVCVWGGQKVGTEVRATQGAEW